MQFTDGSTDMELRLQLGGIKVPSPRNISVDADETSLAIRLKDPEAGTLVTLMETASLFDRIKSSETIWQVEIARILFSCCCFVLRLLTENREKYVEQVLGR